jgi:glycerophosphoryl diester phosphodiesterase
LPLADDRPWIIGHRGIPVRRPENTLAGFDLALQTGADAIELDVHATRDGVVVVHHDPLLRDGRSIATTDLAALHRDVPTREHVPTLADVLSLVGDRAAVFVEVKGHRIEPLVVAEVQRSRARCAIHAFDHRSVRRVRDLAPSLPTGILLASRLVDTVAAMRAAGAGTLWQEAAFIDEALVDEVRAHGGSVIAWTVNDAATMRRLARIGVGGICTDDVELARSALR